MAGFIVAPTKRGYEVDVVKPLKKYIKNTFEYKEAEYEKPLTEFSKLRSQVLIKSAEKHVSSLDVLFRYYDQLCAIESKLPITENEIRIDFKWQDAFGKESFFGGKQTLSIASVGYEKMAVLFNIAALESQIAAGKVDDDEGLKLAAKFFQQAAGIFSHMKDCGHSLIQQEPTPDLVPDTLSTLSAIMVAQAQEVIYIKASRDQMKSAIVAKIAAQCSDFFAEAMKAVQNDATKSHMKDLWPKDWAKTLAGKQAAYHAYAEYHQSEVSKGNKKFGQEIARLQVASELMTAAISRSAGTGTKFEDGLNRIRNALQTAEKDNNFIYHDVVPAKNRLDPIGRATLAKPLPFQHPLSTDFTDIFAMLVPLAVHQAMTDFDNRKGEIINMEVGRIREQNQILTAMLTQMNLPAAIEDVSSEQVPQSVMDKSNKVKGFGGMQAIDKLMNELPQLLKRNQEILDESFKELGEEQTSDDQLRSQFKERWTRTPSSKLTEPIRQEGEKYRGILNNAMQADGLVKEKYKSCKKGGDMLSKPENELRSLIPSGGVSKMSDHPSVKKLKALMEQVEALRNEREVIESEVKGAKFDMTSQFMSALAQDGLVSGETITSDALNAVYSTLRQQITESIERQEALSRQIQEANQEFVGSRQGGGSSRQAVLTELNMAYDTMVELKGNLEEGTKFYNDLTSLLVKFQSKASDFCFARKTEKEELLKDLQTSIARQSVESVPAAPTYQQPPGSSAPVASSTARATPPPRPAPPAPQAQAQAQAPPAQPPSAPQPASPTYSTPAMPAAYNPFAPGPQSYPPQGYPPQPQPGYPPQQPGYPPSYPQQGGYAPYGYPPQGYPPPQQPGYPPQQPYPQQRQPYPGYPPYPQQGQYPGQQQWR